MPIAVAAAFSATVNDAAVAIGGNEAAPIASVAVPVVLSPAGSLTVYVQVELTPKADAVGLNKRPVSCATVSVSPEYTGVTPSDKSTVPSVGRPLTVMVHWGAE